MERVLDARVAQELLDIGARAFAEEVLPRAALEWHTIDETMLPLGLYAFGDRNGRRPSDMDSLRRRSLRHVKPRDVRRRRVVSSRSQAAVWRTEPRTPPAAASDMHRLRHGIAATWTRVSRRPDNIDVSCAIIRCSAPRPCGVRRMQLAGARAMASRFSSQRREV